MRTSKKTAKEKELKKMREHKIYFGKFQTDHYFVEIKKDHYDEWSYEKVISITHRAIVKFRLYERERKAKVILMKYPYFKRGCGDTLRLINVVKSRPDKVRQFSYHYQGITVK